MASDIEADPWPDTSTPDWSPDAVQFDFKDPSKTIPVSWAADLICRWHKRNPSNFGNELAITARRWAADKLGSDEPEGK